METPIVSIIDQIHSIANHLRTVYARERYCVQFKSEESPSGFETATPTLYELNVLTDEMRGGFPTKCPCAVLTVSQIDGDGVAQCALEMCVVDSAFNPAEVAKRIEGNDDLFELGAVGDPITTQNELLRESLRFMELNLRALRNCKTVDISEVSAEAPDPNTPYYPYSTSMIYFSTALNRCKLGENSLNSYF